MSATTLPAPPAPSAAPWTELERDWKLLVRCSENVNPFLSWEWLHAWASQLPSSVRPRVLVERFPSGALAGLLALQLRRRQGWRQLEFLGHGSGADDLDCLLHPNAPPHTAARLLAAAGAQPGWSLLRLESAAADGALAASWPRAFAPAHRRTEGAEWLPTLALPCTWEAYLRAQSANFRAEVRRRQRRFFSRWPAARVVCASTPAEITAAMPHLFRLHNLRRAHKRDRGIFASPRLRAFHLGAAPALAASGLARLYLLHTDDGVAACLYGMEAGPPEARRFLYFQSGLDPALAAFSPGTVLLSAIIQDCITRRVRRFDFLRGEESYKKRWTTARHPSLRLLAARGPAGAAWLRLRDLSHRLRRIPAEANP
ncbi:MAG: GNAT family N-acetyltransferase [Terriglobales bacterium]